MRRPQPVTSTGYTRNPFPAAHVDYQADYGGSEGKTANAPGSGTAGKAMASYFEYSRANEVERRWD